MKPEPLPALLDVGGIMRETGLKRTAAEAIMRQLDKFEVPGVRKTYVRRRDVTRFIEQNTKAA